MIIAPLKEGYRVSQWFGGNKAAYAPYGLKGHNGQDIACPTGTKLYAPIDGAVKVKDTGDAGYGLHITITEEAGKAKRRQVVLAHLSETKVQTGDQVHAGEEIGATGNTGNSTGPHLHFGLRRVNREGHVLDYNNGYKGYEDIFRKGWILQHKTSQY